MSEINYWRIDNNEAVELDYGTVRLQDTNKYTPHGGFTTFRTYNRFGVLRLKKHLDRLDETAKLAGFDIKIDRDGLKHILTSLIEKSSPGEKKIRVTIDLEKSIGTIYIAMESLELPSAYLYQHGIKCRTVEMHRDNPKAKLSVFLDKAAEFREQEKSDCDEFLMYNATGDMLEGLSSNFYAVKADTIYTAEEGVLSGTTRDFILKIASENHVPVCFTPVKKDEIPNLDEGFISSTGRSILPIREIDGYPMKKSAPGPVTGFLMDKFEEEIIDHIESLKD